MISALILEFARLNFPKEKTRILQHSFLILKQFYTASSESELFNNKHLLFIVYGRLIKESRNTFIIMHGVIHLCEPFNVLRGSQ